MKWRFISTNNKQVGITIELNRSEPADHHDKNNQGGNQEADK